jgi:hypothetical protein
MIRGFDTNALIASCIVIPGVILGESLLTEADPHQPMDSTGGSTPQMASRESLRKSAMSDEWQYQIRINLNEGTAEVARRDPANHALKPVTDILTKHNAALKCQFDAFADYVAEAEKQGTEKFPLYKWTKATIENPAKKEKYVKTFTLRVGGEEVYAKEIADALESELQPLVGGGLVTQMAKFNTNPANNPQPPARFR